MDALSLAAALLLLASPALSAEYRGTRDPSGLLTLPPLLLGRLEDPASPLSRAVDAQASALLVEGLDRSIPESAVADRLRGLAADREAPVQRAAALALAAVVAEPDLRASVKALPLSVSHLAVFLQAGSPYRGTGLGEASALVQLAREAQKHRDLMSAVAGEASLRDLDLGGLYFKDGALMARGTERIAPLSGTVSSTLFEHPAVPGALIERYEPAVDAPVFNSWTLREARATRRAEWERSAALVLSAAGVGPRHFGVDYIAEGTIRPKSHVVAVRERVFGPTVDALIRARRFGEEEYGLVDAMLWRLVRARRMPAAPSLRQVKIGRTAADPTPRAYLLAKEPLAPAISDGDEAGLRRAWGNAVVSDSMLPRYDAEGYLGRRFKAAALEDLLRSGIEHSRRRGLVDRFKNGFDDVIDEIGRLPPR